MDKKGGFRTLTEEQETVAGGGAAVADAQKQYFDRGRMQGIFEEGNVEAAQAADAKEVAGLKEAPKKAKGEEAVEVAEEQSERVGSIIAAEGDMTIELNMRRDAKPLSQLTKLQLAYQANRPSRIFHTRHREKLARYVTPNQFDGDVVFHQESAYCLQHRFDEAKWQAQLVVKQIPLAALLDHAESDAAQENYGAKQIGKHKTFDNAAAAKDSARLSPESQQLLYDAFQLKSKKSLSWLQNGKHVYFFSLTRRGAVASGSSAYSLLEVDLESGKESAVPGFDLEEQDGEGGTVVSVGFLKRETDGRYPRAPAVAQSKFVADLKNALIVVKKCQLEKKGNDYSAEGTKITLRSLGAPKSDLATVYEGAFGDRQQRVVGIDGEDALYLQESSMHIQLAPKYTDFSEGALFLHEDAYGQRYFRVFRVARAENGAVTACTADESLQVNADKVEDLNERVHSQNYQFLYDESADAFFFKRGQPVEVGAFLIIDGIMNKIIQFISKADGFSLKLSKLANHGTSFQKLSCKKLTELSSMFPTFKSAHSTLSYALAYKFAELSIKRNQQLVISRRFSNMARCEDTIFYWHQGDINLCKAYEDTDLAVESLGLQHSDYFLNGTIRNSVQSLRMEQQSYISQINHASWQTSQQRAQLSAADVNYTRLFSWDGQMLLARVKGQSGKMLRPSIMGSLMAQNEAAHREDFKQEEKVELFKFQLSGSPDAREEALIKYDQDWRLYYERLRFEDDDRFQRPLVFGRTVRDDADNLIGQRFWLCLFDFKKEQIVRQVGISLPELDVRYEIENVSVAACTEVKQDKSKSSRFNQKYVVAFPLKHQMRVKIIEYTITWDYSEGSNAAVIIRPTGVKEFVQKKDQSGGAALFAPTEGLEEIKLSDMQKFTKPQDQTNIQVLPFLDSTNKICGTQIVVGTGRSAQVFVIEKAEERASNRVSKIPLTKNQGYKLYKDETTLEYSAIMGYSHLTKAMQHDLSLNDQDRIEILEDSVRAVLNSVIFDPTVPVPVDAKDRNYNEKFLKYIDIGRGVEIFDWFSVVSLKSTSEDLQDLLEQSRRPAGTEPERYAASSQLSFLSLLERVLIHELAYQDSYASQVSSLDGQTVDYDRLSTLRSSGTLLYGHEVLQRDIFFNHPLHYLFDIEEAEKSPKDKQVHQILEFVFSKDNGGEAPLHYEAQKHLMGMTVDIVNRPDTQPAFFSNFIAQNDTDYNLNICRKISFDGLPRTQGAELQGFQYQQPEYMLRRDANEVAQQTLRRHTLADGADHPVDCLMLDMRQHNFEQKVKYIKKNVNQEGKLDYEVYDKKKPAFTWTAYDTCVLAAGILEKTDGDIGDQRLLRLITDHQYSLKTRKNSLRMLMLYCFGFFIPFFVQLSWQEHDAVITCNVMCLLTSLFLFRFEIEQMKIQGDAYFESFFNWVDIFGFVTYLTYFCLRMIDPAQQVPSFQQEPIDDLLTVLSFPIILYTAMKLLFYFQMFEGFGLFMHLITETFKNITVFLPFMFFWIFVFSCQMYSLGGSYGTGDYPELHEFLVILIATWRNAIGDIYAPDYSKWSANLQAEDKDKEDQEAVGTTYTYTMITLVWLVWFLNQLFLFLVLTNFLISIIGNSFGDNIGKSTEVSYSNKIDLNVEAALYKKWWGNDKQFDTIVVLSVKEEEEAAQLDSDALLTKINSQMQEQHQQVEALRGAVDAKAK